MSRLDLKFQCGESTLSVRRFSIHETVSTPFTVSIWARSELPTIDLGAIVGQPATLKITSGHKHVRAIGARSWSGVCSYIEQVRGERRPSAKEQSQYYFRIVPMLWLLTHQRLHRIFQHQTLPEIVTKILDSWRVKHKWQIDAGQYPKHEYRIQYGESDFNFVSRLLEEAGIAYTFEDDSTSTMILTDALHQGKPRGGPPVPYENNPTQAAEREYISRIELVHQVRPGALAIRDYDYRKPAFKLLAEAPEAAAPEKKYEQYHYIPGGMFVETGKGGDTPHADDKGVTRHDKPYGEKRAARWLESIRSDRVGVAFESNVTDLMAGMIFNVDNHPHPELAKELLVTDGVFEGTAEGEWAVYGHAVFTDVPFRPPLATPKPNIRGVQVARVVGPPNEEIHTDEFGRIRVQFPWDRDGDWNDDASCWMRAGEGWGGEAYGFINIPRVGHEVIISFLEGDPDRPVIMGRTYNVVNPVPYTLPDHKTVSAWKSRSYPKADGGWYNEIKFEDLKNDELVVLQAQKNMNVLVKNDDDHTVGHDRDKYVIGEEVEVTGKNRTQVVGTDRAEMTSQNLTTFVGAKKVQRIKKDEKEVTELNRKLLVKKNQDLIVRGHKRARVEGDLHAQVVKNRAEHVKEKHSLVVLEEKHEKVGKTFAREAGQQHHIVAGQKLVGEGARDVTIKGPGGFIRIDALGVTIKGTFVKINATGSPGRGQGSSPAEPSEAKTATIPTGSLWKTGPVQSQAITKAMEEKLYKIRRRGKRNLGPTAISLVKLAMQHDVSSPHDGAIFWSGGGHFAGKAADQMVRRRRENNENVTRLEGTDGGSLLAGVSGGIAEDKRTNKQGAAWSELDPAWRVISQRYAKGASGEVHAIVGNVPVGKDAILREEAKTLRANKNVTAIHFWAIKKDAQENAITDANGDYVLEPVSAKDVLAWPKDEPGKKKS